MLRGSLQTLSEPYRVDVPLHFAWLSAIDSL